MDRVLGALGPGEEGDLRALEATWTTLRFADGRIHQPHAERSRSLSLRVADGTKLGIATTTDRSPAGLDRLVRSARALARCAPAERRFPGFPSDDGPVRPVAFSRATATLDFDTACRLAAEAIDAARAVAPEAHVAGVLHVGSEHLRVANTRGLDRSTDRSIAQASVLVEGPDRQAGTSGWSEGAHWDLARLRPSQLAREAAERMPTTVPQPLPAGSYAVVLRGPAVAELLGFLGYLGFGGLAETDGTSCLARSRGRRRFPLPLTLEDDPRAKETLPQAIDFEGLVSRRTGLVRHGRVGAAVCDLVTAGRLGRRPTGHGLRPEAPWGAAGPFPSHLLLAAGTESEEELVRTVRRGLLVTRLHYVRTVDPGSGTITGMTRDGTYRIEHGEVVGPVRNLRFTESVVDVLARLSGLGRTRHLHASEHGGNCQTVPAIASERFRFTSATVF